MISSLIKNNISSAGFTDNSASFVINVNTLEHRYLYSHRIDNTSVLPTVFLLEMALSLLQEARFDEEFNPYQVRISNVTSARFAKITEDRDSKVYFSWKKDADSYFLQVGIDKINASGKVVRSNVDVLTCQLDVSCSPPSSEINRGLDYDLVPRSQIAEFQKTTTGEIGILFWTRNFDYYWHRPTETMIGHTELRRSERYCLTSTAYPSFLTPVLGCMSSVLHLPLYSFIRGEPALPGEIGSIHYVGSIKESKIVTQISPGSQPDRVDITIANSSDCSPISVFNDYQLIKRNML